jgi:alpha-1,3-rhamnosyl/mannosyltransferase
MDEFVIKTEPRVLYLAPMFDTGEPASTASAGQKGRYFIYMGGYHPRKNIHKLVKIFIDLHEKKALSAKLILTGNIHYYSPELKRVIDRGRDLGIVRELGYVSDIELKKLVSGAIALAYPSKYEGFGLPPLEAMALGCPVITTRGTSIPEICEDAVYYIDPDNEGEFADGLIALDSDDPLRERLKAKGFLQAAKFSWERTAKAFLSAVQDTCELKGGRA